MFETYQVSYGERPSILDRLPDLESIAVNQRFEKYFSSGLTGIAQFVLVTSNGVGNASIIGALQKKLTSQTTGMVTATIGNNPSCSLILANRYSDYTSFEIALTNTISDGAFLPSLRFTSNRVLWENTTGSFSVDFSRMPSLSFGIDNSTNEVSKSARVTILQSMNRIDLKYSREVAKDTRIKTKLSIGTIRKSISLGCTKAVSKQTRVTGLMELSTTGTTLYLK
jgi:hypothetical protein